MANLQIKNIQDDLYEEIKKLASAENRSVSQQVLFLVREYLAKRKHLTAAKSPAQVLLELSGSWEDDKNAEQIVKEIKSARKSSRKLEKGF
jgi:predicted CopG family antitoxin